MAKKRTAKQAFKSEKGASKGKERKGEDGRSTMASDWITALAKKAASTDASSSKPVSSKAERIERRAAKKRRRQERKQQKTAVESTRKTGEDNDVRRDKPDAPARQSSSSTHRTAMNRRSQQCMKELESTLHGCISTKDEPDILHRQAYQPPESAKKGKATSGNVLSEDRIQPRPRDYGGLGLARPSMLIPLRDPSFVPKLEEEFAEHVPGFFGKQRTKAMKRQLDGNMLWRQLSEKRAADQKIGGKKLSEMSPDERVEAMIKAGMI
jgi:hypothetical protein